jgi:hypothetical protein
MLAVAHAHLATEAIEPIMKAMAFSIHGGPAQELRAADAASAMA